MMSLGSKEQTASGRQAPGSNLDGIEPKPFLRWAGGKRWLVPHLHLYAPKDYDRYIEPFVGSGAVLFSIPRGKQRLASDANVELINVYETVRDNPLNLIGEIVQHGVELDDYLAARHRFNELKSDPDVSHVERAALFIYLNKTSFNGLYRENSSGQFNVPWGKLARPLGNIGPQIIAASDQLNGDASQNRTRVEFKSGDYRFTLSGAGEGDWVYLDPPYFPASKTSGFVGYTPGGFRYEDQVELSELVVAATHRGARVLLSNSDTPQVRDLYSHDLFTIKPVDVSRSVGASAHTRVKVGEVLVSNYG
jgi:DNA adenine methylase